jgi:FixJ family two-component response regulator
MGRPVVFVVSADAAVSDSVKNLVESAGLPAETFRSLQVFLDMVGPERRGCLVLDAHISDF